MDEVIFVDNISNVQVSFFCIDSCVSGSDFFRVCCSETNLRPRAKMPEITTDHLDEKQVQLLAEMCILIDEDDRKIGADTKKNCHLNSNIDNGLPLELFSKINYSCFSDVMKLKLQPSRQACYTEPSAYSSSTARRSCCSSRGRTPRSLSQVRPQILESCRLTLIQ